MRHEAVGVTESLIESAGNEFLQYGFKDASMRRISAASGVSTNSIYTRFGDKAGIFRAIVQEAADGLMDIYLESIHRAEEALNVENAIREGSDGTDVVLRYIYDHKKEFQLIFCHSTGTEYEDYFDKLAEIEEGYYRKFARKYAQPGKTIDDFFLHVYCRTGWQYMYEVITHDKMYEEANAYMKDVRRFNYAGWKAMLGTDDMSPGNI